MTNILRQSEADKLIQIEKSFKENTLLWPSLGKKQQYEAFSTDSNEKFIVDINHFGFIESRSLTFQNRYSKSIVLIRVDFGRKLHKNPDHQIISGNHIHIYKEGCGVAWAYDFEHVPKKFILRNNLFTDGDDYQYFDDFCSLCNINHVNISYSMV